MTKNLRFLIGRVGYDFVLQCQSTDEDEAPNSMSRRHYDVPDTPPEIQHVRKKKGQREENANILSK